MTDKGQRSRLEPKPRRKDDALARGSLELPRGKRQETGAGQRPRESVEKGNHAHALGGATGSFKENQGAPWAVMPRRMLTITLAFKSQEIAYLVRSQLQT